MSFTLKVMINGATFWAMLLGTVAIYVQAGKTWAHNQSKVSKCIAHPQWESAQSTSLGIATSLKKMPCVSSL